MVLGDLEYITLLTMLENKNAVRGPLVGLRREVREMAQTHMCRFLMETHIEYKGGEKGLVKKPTRFVAAADTSSRNWIAHAPVITTTFHHWSEDEPQEPPSTCKPFVKRFAEGFQNRRKLTTEIT